MPDTPADLFADLETWFARDAEPFTADRTRHVFDNDEYARRLRVLRGLMAQARLDTLVLTAPDAMCWLTGYDSRWYRSHSATTMPPAQCIVVPGDAGPLVHIETGMHEGIARATSCVEEFVAIPGSAFDHEPTLEEFVATVVGELRSRARLPGVIGVERWSSVPNPATLTALEAAVTDAGGTVVDATAPIRRARRAKSAVEIAVVERAQHACDEGIRHLAEHVRREHTELQAWLLFMQGMVAAGGEPTAMHETVAAGPAMPALHLTSSRRTFTGASSFYADAAAAVHRYHARATRLIFFDEIPAHLQRGTEILAGAYEVFAREARVGRSFGDLNRALTAYFDGHGVPGWAGGYELGLSFPPDWVNELSWSSSDADAGEVIEDGTVTNLELCLSGLALVDTAVLTADGARTLSSLPRVCLRAGELPG